MIAKTVCDALEFSRAIIFIYSILICQVVKKFIYYETLVFLSFGAEKRMGEIKSTLDLVMEKTRTLSFTDEEKERLRQAELNRRGEALARRYISEEISYEQLELEMTKENYENQIILKKTLTRFFLESVSLDQPTHRVFRALRYLIKEEMVQCYEKLKEDYVKTSEAHYARIEKDARTELALRGITGSAVVPKVESSSAWQEARSTFEPQFTIELDAIKDNFLHQS